MSHITPHRINGLGQWDDGTGGTRVAGAAIDVCVLLSLDIESLFVMIDNSALGSVCNPGLGAICLCMEPSAS
jgi:hypothetical protein